jgi:hypothetical protein
MTIQNIKFLDSISYLPFPLRKRAGAFDLSASKSCYPHYFNTMENLHYVGPIPDLTYYGAYQMGAAERTQFLERYEGQKTEPFDNRRVLEAYCQDDVTVLREACQVFGRKFMAIGNIEVFLESITIASACKRVFRKRFLNPGTIGLIPTAWYTGNVNYSKKTLMWLVYREQTDGCKILHSGNGREYRLPHFPNLSMDGICVETETVHEFFGCLWHGNTCLHFRDVSTACGETLAERYEQTMQRIETNTWAGYQ